jgi:hypothetical protein
VRKDAETHFTRFEQALQECASEPIHLIGSVQSYDALIVLSAENPLNEADDTVTVLFEVEDIGVVRRTSGDNGNIGACVKGHSGHFLFGHFLLCAIKD